MNHHNNGSSLPFSSRDRSRLADAARHQNFEAALNPLLSALRAPATGMGSSPSQNLAGFFLPETRLLPSPMSMLSHRTPLCASKAGLIAPAQSKFDAIAQQHMQNASILRSSIMDQELQQLISSEDQMRARMMLLPSSPFLQAHPMNGSRFLIGGMGMPGLFTHLPTPNELDFNKDEGHVMKGGVVEPFPVKLHRLLLEVEAAGRADIISFIANGHAFAIHKPDKFCEEIVPKYFRQSRFNSFKRQLNLYGFMLINSGPHRGGYYHKSFIKNRPDLCRNMRRVAVKVPGSNQGNIPDVEERPTSSNTKQDGKLTCSDSKEAEQGARDLGTGQEKCIGKGESASEAASRGE